MKLRYTFSLLCTAILLSCTTGCKTTEANYRAAYEAAKQKQEEDSGISGTIYDRIRQESVSSRLIVDGDSIPMSTVNVRLTANCQPETPLAQYGIAVAQFKQLFNAKAMMNRLRENGYGGAAIVENAEPLYYVIAASASDADSIPELYNKVLNDKRIVKKSPFPWVLKPAHFPYWK